MILEPLKRRWKLWAMALLLLAILLIPAPAAGQKSAERKFRVEAGEFEYNPAVLNVNPGDRVTIELVATDVVHGLHIDGYGLEAIADPGQTARLSFVADRPGSFRVRCPVACGPLHPFMIGKLNVGPNWLLWKAAAAALALAAAGLGRLRL
jgi:heme/copper-type cytochrome/quinol oxidase subunit 2